MEGYEIIVEATWGRLSDVRSKIPLLAAAAVLLLSGCGWTGGDGTVSQQPSSVPADTADVVVEASTAEPQLVPGLSVVRYDGGYGLDDFLSQGGAASDAQAVGFLSSYLSGAVPTLQTEGFGCSTLSVSSPEGHALFGRNLDWDACEALLVQAVPAEDYASVSTVDMGFLGSDLDRSPAQARTMADLYAPLDGMNQKGLCVAVLMIWDHASIDQSTEKPDLTTTTAVRRCCWTGPLMWRRRWPRWSSMTFTPPWA